MRTSLVSTCQVTFGKRVDVRNNLKRKFMTILHRIQLYLHRIRRQMSIALIFVIIIIIIAVVVVVVVRIAMTGIRKRGQN